MLVPYGRAPHMLNSGGTDLMFAVDTSTGGGSAIEYVGTVDIVVLGHSRHPAPHRLQPATGSRGAHPQARLRQLRPRPAHAASRTAGRHDGRGRQHRIRAADSARPGQPALPDDARPRGPVRRRQNRRRHHRRAASRLPPAAPQTRAGRAAAPPSAPVELLDHRGE
ncbi:conserved hypothetical protein, partial [Ricinus communis]